MTTSEMQQNVIQRFYDFPKPSIEPWFPEDMSKTNDEVLGQLLTLYVKWKNYASQQVSFTDAELIILKEEIKFVEAQELIKLNEDKDLKREYSAKDDRIAYVTQLPEVREKRKTISKLEAQMKMEKSIYESFEDRYSAASREITRRQSR